MHFAYEEVIENCSNMSKTDVNGVITFVNEEFCKTTGYSKEELIGNTHSILNHPDNDPQKFEELWTCIINKKIYNGVIKNLTKNNEIIYLKTTIYPIMNKAGQITQFVSMRYDITKEIMLELENERKSLEVLQSQAKIKEQEKLLFQQNKMAAMGEMLEIIAHQWRQPLSVMSTVASSMRLKQQLKKLDEEKIYMYTDSITESVDYLSQTIDDFRSYFGSDNSSIRFNINNTFDKVLKLLHLKKSIQIIRNVEELELFNNENELVQILMNILNNTRDEFDSKKLKTKLIFIECYKQDNRVTIKLRDNAGGIPDDIIGKVFEPYFTTKAQEGTGLGLYMCKELMQKNLKGEIIVSNVSYDWEGDTYQGAEFLLSWTV